MISSLNNKCIDVPSASFVDGARLQMWGCNGTGAQQFVLSGAGDLANPQSGKCVGIVDVNPDDGAKLQLWDCAGSSHQKWRKG